MDSNRPKWTEKLKYKVTREMFCAKLAVLSAPRAVIKEIREAYPECQSKTGNAKERKDRDYRDIYAAISTFNPNDARFNEAKYGEVARLARLREIDAAFSELIPSFVLTAEGMKADVKRMNEAPDETNSSQAQARKNAALAQKELLAHAQELRKAFDRDGEDGDSGSEITEDARNQRARRYAEDCFASGTRRPRSGTES